LISEKQEQNLADTTLFPLGGCIQKFLYDISSSRHDERDTISSISSDLQCGEAAAASAKIAIE